MRHVFEAWVHDARQASRSVRQHLQFFLLAMAIMGLGVGACTAVFSVMRPLMLHPLPFATPEQLVWIANDGSGGMSAVTSRTSNLRDFRELSQSFTGLTGYNAFFEEDSHNLIGEGEPERLIGVGVAHNFLDVLGVVPTRGRNFLPEEGAWGGPRAIILTHGFWTRRFAAEPSVVGRFLRLDEAAYEVVGILPASFDFSDTFAPHTRVDFLQTFPISDETDRWGNTLSIIGRLKPDATVASAQADLDVVLERLAADDPERWGLGATVSGLQGQIAAPYRTAFVLLAAAAATVLLIVCVNLSNLLLARGPKRTREMAIRSAMGAPRGRLLRLLAFESLAIAVGGALLGCALARLATGWVAASRGLDIPLLRGVAVDGSAVLLALVIAAAAALTAGLVPAWRATAGNEASTIKNAFRGSTSGRHNTRLLEALVVSEVALACVLLVSGGLLLKSFSNVLDVELGFQPAELVAWQINSSRDFDSLPAATAYYAHLADRVEAIPGVEHVGLTDAAPLGRNRTWGLRAPGREYGESSFLFAFPHIVDSGYLGAMGIRLLEGRNFTPDDTPETDGVVLLNASAARAVYHGEDVLGRTIEAGGGQYRIVGIVEDVRHRSLEEASGLEMYFPLSQNGDYGTLDLMVRSRLSETALAASVAGAIETVDPTMPTGDFQSFSGVVDRAASPRRFTLSVLAAFALSALLLAALGIYGVLSYSVTEKTPEIGIRMALGATASAVLGRVVGKTVLLSALGVVLGGVGSLAMAHLLGSLLYGVRPSDPQIYGVMALLVLGVAALAGLRPGLRASQTDPARTLRSS